MRAKPWIGPVVFAVVLFLLTRSIIGQNKPAQSKNAVRIETGQLSDDNDPEIGRALLPLATAPIRGGLLAPTLSFRQKTLKDYGHQADFTWSAIDRAESELSMGTIEGMLLSATPFLPTDCLEGEEDWSGFSYSLYVNSSKEGVTVGEFRVENSSMPARVSSCLEEVFAGESTIDSDYKEGADERLGFLEFETRLERKDSLVQGMMFAVKTRGRESYLSEMEDGFCEHRREEQAREELRQKLKLVLP